LRDRARFPAPRDRQSVPLVIVGGGIAGLCAAWRLQKRGFRDFVLLEMDSQAGGNSKWGENDVSAYPWAAHYVPVPNKEAALVRELFEEFGLLRGGEWDERHLCHSPQERLYLHGRWQEGLEPEVGVTKDHHAQYRRFEERIRELRASGQFTIPLERGAKPSRLDQISMADWMAEQRFDSAYLGWYVNYACRDDYGATARATSAWAGIHYFASREHEETGPLTWPEGNGWIVRRLLERVGGHVRTGAFVRAILKDGRRWRVVAGQTEYRCAAVIFAAPTFLANYVLEEPVDLRSFVYSPWLTANLTLDRLPREPYGEPAWDNVIYDSPALGYVVATHQSLRTRIDRTVWTYYWALAQGTPQANRALLLDKDWGYWKEAILRDLAKAHPDIRECVSRLDILRLGHAMACPVPGAVFSAQRARLARGRGTLFFANSDVSGISIFEEAQHHGVRAADQALAVLGRP